jgi:Spy/CpxP family protein refolding chaperone
MKTLPPIFKQLLIAAGIALALPLSAQGEPPQDGGREHCTGPMIPPPGHGPEKMMPGGMFPTDDVFPPNSGAVPPFLHGVTLTEAQQDKIFSIMHAAAPLLREQDKFARKSAEGIRHLAASGQYDEGKLKSLADSNARAMAEIMILRVRSAHQIYSLLTPEQRAQVEEIKAKFDTHRGLRAQIEEMKPKFDASHGSNGR